jgi:hypothetical protein
MNTDNLIMPQDMTLEKLYQMLEAHRRSDQSVKDAAIKQMSTQIGELREEVTRLAGLLEDALEEVVYEREE